MATFFSSAFGLASGEPASFIDISGTIHQSAINALASARITAGCSSDPPRYCPGHEITVGQMATFLARALGLVPLVDSSPYEAGERYIAFDTPGGYQVTDLAGNEQWVLGHLRGMSWAPDGTHVVFHRPTEHGRISRVVSGLINAVWKVNATGNNEVRLTKYGQDAVWSPAGALIAYGLERWGDRGILVMNTDGRDQLRIRDGGWFPSWSPDGTKIAFHSGHGYVLRDNTLWKAVYVMNSDGRDERQLSDVHVLPESFRRLYDELLWSPDGTSITYLRFNPAGAYEDQWELWIVSVDGTSDQRLAFAMDSSWSPDGTRIAYVHDYELWVMNADGTNKQLLADDGIDPAWSPEGTTIAYTVTNSVTNTYDNTAFEVWLMDADGSNQRKLVDGYDPIWIPQPETTP